VTNLSGNDSRLKEYMGRNVNVCLLSQLIIFCKNEFQF